MNFFRYPHTPHLAWLGKGTPRDDKVLSPAEADELLARDLLVEEKVDGANVGLSVDEEETLWAQNRGSFLLPESSHPQFKPLFRWLDLRRDLLIDALYPDLMLFGEWCYAVHSLRYTRLPDWFLAFDVYDRTHQAFWSAARRDEWVGQLDLALVPRLARGRFDLPGLVDLLDHSRLRKGPPEGLYLRWDEGDWSKKRAKLVRPEFTQAIAEHWSRHALQTNQIAERTVWT